MENIFIIKPASAAQTPVVAYLAELKVECMEFSSVSGAEVSADKPKVVLLFADSSLVNFQKDLKTLRQSPVLSKTPRLLFLPPDLARIMGRTSELEGEAIFRLPLDKTALLARLASMKKGVHRRVFQILIRIQPQGTNLWYFGKSFDFSESGIAFECNEAFSEGQQVIISFTNPRNKKRIMLESEIIRKESLAAGDKAFYGAKFIDSMAATVRDLVEFIAAEDTV